MTRRCGFIAERLDTGAKEFVWANGSPAYGSVFEEGGVRYRRPVPAGYVGRRAAMNRGDEADFSRGPITMFTEPLQGHGPVAAPHYDANGLAVFTSNREIKEYRAKCADSSRPVEWTK